MWLTWGFGERPLQPAPKLVFQTNAPATMERQQSLLEMKFQSSAKRMAKRIAQHVRLQDFLCRRRQELGVKHVL